MNRRPRKVPSWLEGTSKKKTQNSKLTFTTLPKTVIYVMSPRELKEVSENILREEIQEDKGACESHQSGEEQQLHS